MTDGAGVRRPRRGRPGRGAAARRAGRRRAVRAGGARPRPGAARVQHDVPRSTPTTGGAWRCGSTPTPRAPPPTSPPSRPGCTPWPPRPTVRVPDPLAAPGGGWHVAVDCPQWGGPLHATVASWLDGDDVGQCDEEQARALGRTMAALHDHAEGFTLPAGGAPDPVRRAALPRPQPARGRRADAERPRRGGGRVARAVPAPVRRGVRRAAPDRAARRPARRQPEVARGPPGGLRPRRRRASGCPPWTWRSPRSTCARGPPASSRPCARATREVRDLPDVSDEQFEALVAARQLLLANSLLSSSTASLRAEATDYLDVTVQRLRGWLATGRFSRSPAPDAGQGTARRTRRNRVAAARPASIPLAWAALAARHTRHHQESLDVCPDHRQRRRKRAIGAGADHRRRAVRRATAPCSSPGSTASCATSPTCSPTATSSSR